MQLDQEIQKTKVRNCIKEVLIRVSLMSSQTRLNLTQSTPFEACTYINTYIGTYICTDIQTYIAKSWFLTLKKRIKLNKQQPKFADLWYQDVQWLPSQAKLKMLCKLPVSNATSFSHVTHVEKGRLKVCLGICLFLSTDQQVLFVVVIVRIKININNNNN